MFIKPTTFIVGAGASEEVGMPIGSKLRLSLAQKLNLRFENFSSLISGSPEIAVAMRHYAKLHTLSDVNALRRAGVEISEAMTKDLAASIDAYLDTHIDDKNIMTMGKLGIAAAILEEEAGSALAFKDRIPTIANVAGKWYPSFLKLLGDAVKASNPEPIFDNVTIVCFNYDRCIEHYLYWALPPKLRCSQEVARDLIERLNIIHPYGTVGALPWESRPTNLRVEFGGERNENVLLQAVEGISTYTQEIRDKVKVDKIKKAVQEADALIFLGFGFLRHNLTLLKPENRCKASEVFMTMHGHSDPDKERLKARLRRDFFDDDKLVQFHTSEKCSNLFNEHWQGLLEYVST